MARSSHNHGRARKHRIFLVDDHPVTREGLARLINLEPDLEVCGQAGTAASALTAIDTLHPELVIVDVSLSGGAGGLELTKNLSSRRRHPRILVLSTHDESLYAERALRAGAKGYVMKHESTERIMSSIRDVLHGQIAVSRAISSQMLQRVSHKQKGHAASEFELLSDRELEVFRLIGQGRGTRQIAAGLHLSVSTVETHRTHIKEKLHLRSAPELVRRAVEWVHSRAS